MIHDPVIEVTCDGVGCETAIKIEPDFRYRSWSGEDGEYDTRDSSLAEKIQAIGWSVGEDKHLCDTCSTDSLAVEKAP